MQTRRLLTISMSLLLLSFAAGCGDNECEIDSDCAQGQLCADAGGVLFASKVCVAASDAPRADMSTPSDMAADTSNINNTNNTNNTNNINNTAADMGVDMRPAAEDMDVPDSCTPESNEDYCERLAKTCGLVSQMDNCGLMRTANCGDCMAPAECSSTNVCGCESESDDDFCDRLGLDCEMVTADDNCEISRTVHCGTCRGGEVCGEQAPNVCGCPCNIGGTCYPDGSQNPSNPCEVCDPGQSTSTWSVRTGSCDDGDPCTANDSCSSSGVCSGTERFCPNTGQCQDSFCDPANGQCVTMNLNGACDDGSACTTGDSCSNGICSGTPKLCRSSGQCESAFCDPATGMCQTTDLSGPCDDGDSCTTADQCVSGNCQGSPVLCIDPGPCQSAACNPLTGSCDITNVSGSCSDGDLCTQNDTCSNGTCSGTPVSCADPGVCQSASCNPSTGACVTSNDPNGTPCTDSEFCTVNTECSGGSCVGDLRQCNFVGVSCSYFCDEINNQCSKVDPMCIEM